MSAGWLDVSDVSLAPSERLDADEFRLLWVDDWYDGPLAGMVARGGERFYLVVHDRGVLGTDQPWRWVALRLSPAALDEQLEQHALFAHHVGEHWCSHEARDPEIEGERSPGAFYAQQATRPSLTRADAEVVGWFDTALAPERPRTRT